MKFDSRETYLVAVQDWKTRFLAHIQTIRASKLNVKGAQRALSKCKLPIYYPSKARGETATTQEENKLWSNMYSNLEDELLNRKQQKETTEALVHERWQGKVEAQRQYLARKAGS